MARYLRQNTATIVTVGPFYDKTDGVTIETGLTITNERITFIVDNNDGSAPTLVLDNVTGATSGTSNDLNYITSNDAGLMQLELAAANVNYVGRAFLSITDAANHCPVFHEFTILPGQVYDSLVLGTDLLDANASQHGGTSQTGRDIGASVLLSVGTGTGQVNLSSGKVPATLAAADVTGNVATDIQTIKTQAVTCAAGVTVLASVGTAATSTAQTGDSYARIGAAGASLTALGDTRLANLDATVSSRSTYAGGAVASVTAPVTVGTNSDKTGYELSATGIDGILDEAVEGTTTFREMMRGVFAALANILAGAGTTTITVRDIADSKDRITATVDADGNRSAVTLDLA